MTTAAPATTEPRADRWWWLRAVFDVVTEPVRRGRLRGDGWHPGLRAVVTVSLVLYVAALALLALAPEVRAHGELVVVGHVSMPRASVFFFLGVVLWCLALLQAAALHGPVWMRLGALILVGVTVATFADARGTRTTWSVVAAGIAGLVVLTALRWRRTPVWWEVPVCLVLVAGPSLVATALATSYLSGLGVDGMPLLLSLQFQRLDALALPAALVGGAAVAELAVSTGDKVARAGARVPRLLVPVVLVLGVWRLVSTALTAGDLGTSTHRVWVEWLSAAALLAVAGAWGWWLLRAGTEPSAPVDLEETADEVGVVGLPLAAALMGLLLPSIVLVSLAALLPPDLAVHRWVADLNTHLVTTTVITWVRVAIGVLLLAAAHSWRDRLPPVRRLLLGEIGLVLVAVHVGQASGGRATWPYTTLAVVDVAAAAALLVFVVLLVRRALTPLRAGVLGAVVVVPWAFRFADVIDAPFTTLLGLSGIGVTLFGLVWALLTGASDANGDSPRFPRQTRVLLFVTQSVYALTVLVYLGVVRGTAGQRFSPADSTELGAAVLGVPLLVSALVVLAARVARPEAEPQTIGSRDSR